MAGAEEFYEAFPVVYVEVINVLGVDDIGDAEAVALNDIGRSLHGDAHLGREGKGAEEQEKEKGETSANMPSAQPGKAGGEAGGEGGGA